MYAHPEHFHAGAVNPRSELDERWRELCSQYLPFPSENSIWLLSRSAAASDPEQGWKIHVSATVLTACTVLEKIAPLLSGCGILFKAPNSLIEAQKINSGLYYGYSQVGKLFTVYPGTPAEAVNIARQLYELLGSTSAPTVPFDRRLYPDSCIYYRYGAFKRLEIENEDGTRTLAIRDPQGRLVPDLRDAPAGSPVWAVSPFTEQPPDAPATSVESPLKTTYRAFRALTQRGRGGVYEAVDMRHASPRFCIIKEGRREGELNWDGRDGSWRVRNEESVLASLRAASVEVPRIYDSFGVDGNYYLVTEFIEGETLQAHLLRRRRRLSMSRALRLGAGVALLLARIHAAGWSWRDCKPSNIMLTKTGALRPLDFEGGCPGDRPDPMPWGTQGFTPPERLPDAVSRVYEDLYALGATIHLLLTGELPRPSSPTPLGKLRRGIPSEVCRLIAGLLAVNVGRQPSAQDAADRLLEISPAANHASKA
ncbi:MAG: lipopolysaccharide kinase InaA family protein [Pyrinomonadaceae bacterium]